MWRRGGIRVYKPKHIAGSVKSSGMQLYSASRRGSEDLGPLRARKRPGFITAPAIDHDNFLLTLELLQSAERFGDALLFVQCGNNNADEHRYA
jgi:hypothetical protein